MLPRSFISGGNKSFDSGKMCFHHSVASLPQCSCISIRFSGSQVSSMEVITFLCNLSKTERAMPSLKCNEKMLCFVIAQAFVPLYAHSQPQHEKRKGRFGQGTSAALKGIWEEVLLLLGESLSRPQATAPGSFLLQLLLRLYVWMLLCGSCQIKRKHSSAQAGCLCPLICKKQNPTKQVPVLIASPKGMNWEQEKELSFKTVVGANKDLERPG